MASMENVKGQTFIAGSDLTGGQYKFVEIAADSAVDLVGAAGGDALGVLLNKPDVGQAATVAVSGRVKVVTGTGGLDEGQYIMSSATGEAIVHTNAVGTFRIGKCVKAAAAGELAEVQLGANYLATA